MAGHFHLAPFVCDFAVFIEHKRAAFDAERFFAIEFFQLDYVKQFAHGFVFIAQQFKLKALLGAKILVRFDAVARDAGHGVAQRFKLRQARVEIVAFGGAAGRVVIGLKIHNQRQMFVRYKILAAGSGQGERISRHNKAPESFRRPYLTASAPAAPR